ncbi:unnamed protein product, partial [Ectocarpus sp. 12 AP-2014]
TWTSGRGSCPWRTPSSPLSWPMSTTPSPRGTRSTKPSWPSSRSTASAAAPLGRACSGAVPGPPFWRRCAGSTPRSSRGWGRCPGSGSSTRTCAAFFKPFSAT